MWLEGYTAKWRVCKVDPDTWADSSDVDGVTAISVSRSCDSDVPLLEEGEVTADYEIGTGWVRVYLYADGVREAIATLHAERGKDTADSFTSPCYSVLKPVDDMRMASLEHAYMPAGADGAEWAGRLIGECTPAPVSVECSYTVNEAYVFDPEHTVLEEAWALLDVGNCCIQIDGEGTVHVREMPTEATLTVDSETAVLFIGKAETEVDLDGVPNRYYASDGEGTAVAVNDDPDSITSHQRRGRWIDEYDSSPTLVNGEPLEVYASRRLSELSSGVTATVSYERDYWPGVYPYSVVMGSRPSDGFEGEMRVIAQSIECGVGAKVTETCVKEASYL